MGIPLYREASDATHSNNGAPIVKIPGSCPYVEAFVARRDDESSSSSTGRARSSQGAASLRSHHHHHHHHHHRVRGNEEMEERQRRLYLSARRHGARVPTLTAAESRTGSSEEEEEEEDDDEESAAARGARPSVMSAQVEGMDIEMHMDMQTGETWATPAEPEQMIPLLRHRSRQVPVLIRQATDNPGRGVPGSEATSQADAMDDGLRDARSEP